MARKKKSKTLKTEEIIELKKEPIKLKLKIKAVNESEVERQIRLALNRERSRLTRANENEMERQRRLQVNRERTRERRENETPEQRETRLASNRARTELRRLNMSQVERMIVMEKDKQSHRERRRTENEEKRQRRLSIDRERKRQKRAILGIRKERTTRVKMPYNPTNSKATINFEHLTRDAVNRERLRLQRFTLTPEEEEEIAAADRLGIYNRREGESDHQYQERLYQMKTDWGRLILPQQHQKQAELNLVPPSVPPNGHPNNYYPKDSITILLEKIQAGMGEDVEDGEVNPIVIPHLTKLKLTVLKNKLQLEKTLWILKQMREKWEHQQQQQDNNQAEGYTIADQMKEMYNFIKDLSEEKEKTTP